MLGQIEETCLVDEEDKACSEDRRMIAGEQDEVRSCRAGVLVQVEETYLVDGKTCREDVNKVTKSVIEKSEVPLLAKYKNLVGS